jgi:hypothetical protein
MTIVSRLGNRTPYFTILQEGEKANRQITNPILNDGIFYCQRLFLDEFSCKFICSSCSSKGKTVAIISSVVQFHHKLRSDNNKIKAESKQSKYMHN